MENPLKLETFGPAFTNMRLPWKLKYAKNVKKILKDLRKFMDDWQVMGSWRTLEDLLYITKFPCHQLFVL